MSEMMTSLASTVFDWTKLEVRQTKSGSSRPITKSKTGTLDLLSMHASTLEPGLAAHAPHRHPEEELIILREGKLEALVNETRTQMTPGSILFLAPNDLHGVTNIGDTPATYFVIKWFPPGMKSAK